MVNDKCFVFVPSYNHAPFIERGLRSIFRQTLPPAKLLVIDDGSRDDSPAIIRRVLADCPFPAELIARGNRGLCRTLNEGFAASADADFFAYLGSDDLWLPDFLANRVELLRANPAAILGYGNAFLIDADDAILENSADWGAYKFPHRWEMLLRGFAPVSSTVVYRRAAIADLSWNADARLEDYEFYLKCAARGEFAFDAAARAGWRQHGGNTSDDAPFMLGEVLAAQNRNRDLINLSDAELRRRQRTVKFAYAEIMARRDLKSQAWRLTLENWRGANSNLDLIKMLARLLAPRRFFERKKKRAETLKIG